MKNSILLEGLQDTHSDFEFARRQWDKLGLGVNFDDAYNAYYKKNYDPEHWDDWRDPVYSEEAWNELVQSAGEENESLRRKQEKMLDESWEAPADYAWYFLDNGADVDEIKRVLNNDGHNDEDFFMEVLDLMDEYSYYSDDYEGYEWGDDIEESLNEGTKREILKSKNGVELKSTGDDYEIWVNGRIDSSFYDSYKEALKEFNKLVRRSLTEGALSNGSYSLYNGWVKVPDKDSIPDVNEKEVENVLQPFLDRYNKIINN